MRSSDVLPLRDEPKIQTRRSSLRSRLKPLSPIGLSIVSAFPAGQTARARYPLRWPGNATARAAETRRRDRGAPGGPRPPPPPRGGGGGGLFGGGAGGGIPSDPLPSMVG